MMLIKSIRLKNIRSYLDEKLEIPLGSTLLSGDIGCGKSTVLMAIDFALFGLRKGELSASDLLRHGKDDGLVELEFQLDSKLIKVRRNLKRASSISQENGTLSVNGLSETLTPMELKARVLDFLGYPMELMKKNKPIFRYTVYTPQEDMKKILVESEDRLNILRKIFSLDKYGTIRDNARLFITELRGMKREQEAYSRDLEAKKEERKTLADSSQEMESQLSFLKDKLAAIVQKYEEKKKDADKLKQEIENFNRIRLSLAKKEAEASSLKKKVDDLRGEISNIYSKIQFNENLMTEIPEGSRDEILSIIKLTETERDRMIRHVAILDTEIEKLSNIHMKGICSFCGQNVSDPESFKKHIDERIEKRSFILDEVKQADLKLDEMKRQRSVLEKYAGIHRTIEDLKSWKVEKEKSLLTSSSFLESSEKELVSLRKESEKYEGLESSSRAGEQELLNLQKEMLDHEKSRSRAEQQREDMAKRLSSLENEIREKEAARSKAERIASLASWFDNFLLVMENIERHVLLTVQREFDQYFQYWFSVLMGDTLSVRISDDFSPVIEQNGYETSFDNLSGGEKTSISLAYRLALNKVINIMIDQIRTKDIIILDEPTDGFSTDQLDRVRDVINALGLKQIILVSHEPKIDTYVENVIKIYKEDHISRIAL